MFFARKDSIINNYKKYQPSIYNSCLKSVFKAKLKKNTYLLNKSSFNDKPRFVLIDNIEFLNLNSVNALLKVLEEPSENVYFILINNNKNITPTLLSRCINFKIALTNENNLYIASKLLNEDLNDIINKDLINYYFTPGNLYNLVNFSKENDYDLENLNLEELLRLMIDNNHYKNDNLLKNLIFEFIEFYFNQISSSLSFRFINEYNYFLKRISDTRRFNLDEESLFIEFKEKVLNG